MSIYGIKKSDATRQTINLIQLGDCMKLVVKKPAVHEGVRNQSALCCLKGMLLEASFSKSLNQSQRDTLETYAGMICCLSWN